MTQAIYPGPTQRQTYTVRCWHNATGGFRVRVIDVLTGVEYPVTSLTDLPPLIEQLMGRSHASSEDGVSSEGVEGREG